MGGVLATRSAVMATAPAYSLLCESNASEIHRLGEDSRMFLHTRTAIIILVLVVLSGSAWATKYTVYPIADTTFQDLFKDTTYPLWPSLFVGYAPYSGYEGALWESVLKWDLSSYAAGDIGSCNLYMYCWDANASSLGGCPVGVHEVTRDSTDWDETFAITWNMVYGNPSSMDYKSAYESLNNVSENNEGTWISWTVTNAVGNHEDGDCSLYVKAYNPSSGQYAKFSALQEDIPNGDYRPYIKFDYTPPTNENDTCNLTEMFGVCLVRPETGWLRGNVELATNDYSPATSCFGWSAYGKDVVFYMDLETGDYLDMTYTQLDYDAAFYIVTDCADMNSCVVGADATLTGQPEHLEYTVEDDDRYYLILDCYGVDTGGSWTLDYAIEGYGTGVKDVETRHAGTAFLAPKPNPSKPDLAIRFTLGSPGQVGLRVFDVAGRLVRDLSPGFVHAGYHSVPWDGKDSFGNDVSAGVYLVRMEVHGRSYHQKAVVLR